MENSVPHSEGALPFLQAGLSKRQVRDLAKMTLLEDCHTMIRALAGDAPIYFDSALQVKRTPHSPAFAAWAVALSEDGILQVMDAGEQWHPCAAGDRNAGVVLGSLYQRLRMLQAHRRKTG